MIVGAHKPMNNANCFSSNTRNKNIENTIENATHNKSISSAIGGVLLDFIINLYCLIR